jgi:hypothetical protein
MTAYISVRQIMGKITANASGNGTTEIDIAGRVVKEIVYASTTGAYVTIKELITGGELTLSGDTLFERVITGNATHIPVVNVTDITGSTIGAQYVQPTADRVLVTIASGGNLGRLETHIFVR